jgi:DNA-binding response OmpR family regulator
MGGACQLQARTGQRKGKGVAAATRIREPVLVRLLVVEDDPTISEPLVSGLRREGFDVDLVVTGEAALAAEPADMVLLDLGLPDLDGRVVCRELRKQSSVPIIVVTARGDEIDRVMLLELGADDYVVKPFGFRELVARIGAVHRRTDATLRQSTETVTTWGELVIDRRTRNVTCDGDDVVLTPKEYDLLIELASDPGAIFTREHLMSQVWDRNWWGSTKTLDVHVASLRKKLRPEYIETVRGVGYRLADAVTTP